MKKTIIVVLLVALVATPCFAKEPVTISSIEGTLWGGQVTTLYVYNGSHLETITGDVTLGFSDGTMYMCITRPGYTCTPQAYREPSGPTVILNAFGLAMSWGMDVSIYGFSSRHLFFQTMPWEVGYFYLSGTLILLNAPKMGSGIVMTYSYGRLERESADWSP